MAESQIVYILENPSMPGLIKIGVTGRSGVEERMKELYTSGVPVPFVCRFACKVKDAADAERALHDAFDDSRVNPKREFFRLAADRVISVLRLILVEEVTSEMKKALDSATNVEDRNSGERLSRSRRPNLNFKELGIPAGSVLMFRGRDAQVKVLGERQVEYQGEQTSLTAATRKVLGHEDDYTLQPSPYWSFNGRRLSEIYEDFHGDEAA